LPFRRQEQPYSCTVACLRMLLAHHGTEIDESTLRQRCKTGELGTYARDILGCARELGFAASIEHLSLERLRLLVDQGIFPIAYINMFPTSRIPYTHTVIVEAYEADRLLVVDPYVGPWEIQVSDFLEAWEIHGNMALVLQMEST
jgi:ABC-type bacteriocin/lantibiotic exporter with double-glycine peptidase domain